MILKKINVYMIVLSIWFKLSSCRESSLKIADNCLKSSKSYSQN